MAQYPIPQFIESESKIISFLTFRQFFVLVGAGAICAILFYTTPFLVFAICSTLIGLLAAAIAFLKIDNVSILKFVLNLISFFARSKNYVWKKKDAPYPFKVNINQDMKNVEGFNAIKTQPANLKDAKKIVELRKKV